MQKKLRLAVVFGGAEKPARGTKFGEGRAELLRLVDEEGSLRRAVARLGMSYRAAWGYIRELEASAGFSLLERAGKGPAGGMRLTRQGRRFLASFDAFHAEVDAAADRAFRRAFGGKPGRRAPARRKRSQPGN